MRGMDFGFPAAEYLSVRLELDRETESGESRDASRAAYVARFGAAYADSVALLQVSRTVQGITGVEAAQVAMATPLNREVLTGMGFAVPEDATDAESAFRAADLAMYRAKRAGKNRVST